jgi:phosphopantothenoylcysteine decarboxylase/phosphopantothenate--cysteine ligase
VLNGKSLLLVITGGIAAYKALELIRRLRDRGVRVRVIMTGSAANFVTPLSVATLSGERVFQDLFSLTDETEIGHITLARDCDLVVVAPATANIIAKMAHGLADDLASTALLATDRPILLAPAMNSRMWNHPATQANLALIRDRGVATVGPGTGFLAEGENGIGRMAEIPEIMAAIEARFAPKPLHGVRVVVTSGPTVEPIDPVRVIANRSTGKQGHAIAQAFADLGAAVTLVSGPVALPDPSGCATVHVETAVQMQNAVSQALPADVAVCAAAVADWRVANAASSKIKKVKGAPPPALEFAPNPDILAALSAPGPNRPRLVIGFAAETDDLIANATAKRASKGCDWILANDVSQAQSSFGADTNRVHLIRSDGAQEWPLMSKAEVARTLAVTVANHLGKSS